MSARSLFVAICLFWAGMLVGVSFIATPAKFLAPSLSLPVALEVGRHTFATFTKVEAAAALACFGLTLLMSTRRVAMSVAATLAILLGIQAFALTPELDRRVAMYIAGQVPPVSMLHAVYVGIELLKLIVLIGAAIVLSRSNAEVRSAND